MKNLLLSNGYYAVVDDEDYDWLKQWTWHAATNKYAARCRRKKEPARNYQTLMHRLITKCPKNRQVDHINGNRLDNRRKNLRIIKIEENGFNRGINKNNTSGYRGVYWNTICKKWGAQIMLNRKNHYLGLFTNPIDASQAYESTARKLFGKFYRAL